MSFIVPRDPRGRVNLDSETETMQSSFLSCGKFFFFSCVPHAGDDYSKALVDSVMTSVKGGTLESAVTMRAKLNKEGVMDIDTYQNWARTIADAPALLYSEVRTTKT